MSTNLVAAITSKALDGLFARQTATAHNVANASSENFTPARVSFEDALREAATARPGDSPDAMLTRVASVRPTLTTPLPVDFNTVKLDQEIETASETSARYAMLIGMLDRSLQIQQLAVKGA